MGQAAAASESNTTKEILSYFAGKAHQCCLCSYLQQINLTSSLVEGNHMGGSSPHRNVAVFIDLENMFGGYAGGVSGVPLSRMLREIERDVERLGFGFKAAATRAYANWAFPGMKLYQREVLENGIEPVQIFSNDGTTKGKGGAGEVDADPPARRKNAADIQLVVDALTIAEDAPWVEVFVIVSGDGDFVPLVRRLQYLDKFVVGVTIRNGSAGGVSNLFRSVVDRFLEVDAAAPIGKVVSDAQTPESGPAVRVAGSGGGTGLGLPSNERPSEATYVSAVHKIIADAPRALKEGAVDGAVVNPMLRRSWPRVTYLDYGYKSFGEFIVEACGLQIYHPSSTSGKETPPSEDALSARDQRSALENVAPVVTYPPVRALNVVLEALTLLDAAMSPEALIDRVGAQSEGVPAEQVRLAMSLLFSVGAFKETDGDRLILSADVSSVTAGKSLVLEDARRRAVTLGMSIADNALEDVVFGDEAAGS